MRKGKGREARLSFMGHAMMENGNGLLMDFLVSRATGRAEREAVPVMLDDARQRGYRPKTLGADKGYDTRECVRAMRNRGVTPPCGPASALGYRRAHHEARWLQGEPEGAQEGGGGVRMDEDGGRIPEDTVPWSREDRGWLGTWWLRPTTWCGWLIWWRVRGLGPFRRRDRPGVQCAPVGPPSPCSSPHGPWQISQTAFRLTWKRYRPQN